jgi:hypothetical protein
MFDLQASATQTNRGLKAAHLQMSQNISRKSIFKKNVLKFKKGKNIQNPSHTLHFMGSLRLILQYFITKFLYFLLTQ